jgi:Phage Tail Collar Domain
MKQSKSEKDHLLTLEDGGEDAGGIWGRIKKNITAHNLLEGGKILLLAVMLIGGAIGIEEQSKKAAHLAATLTEMHERVQFLEELTLDIIGNETLLSALRLLSKVKPLSEELKRLNTTAKEIWISLAELNETLATVGYVPVGALMPFGTSAPPVGWLVCNGEAINRTDYAALFSIIGTTFGSGDGNITFNLPDMRGRTIVGAGAGPGLTGKFLRV